MKHYLITAVLLWSIVIIAFGQKRPQKKIVTTKELTIQSVNPWMNKGFVTLRTDGEERSNQVSLQYFDLAEQKQTSQKLFNFRQRGVDGQLEGSFIWNDKLHLLYSRYHPGPKRNYLFHDQYRLPDLEKEKSLRIDEAYTPGLYRLPFGYSISPDSSKILFYSWSYALPDAPAKLALHVYDGDMNLLWKQRYILPYKNETLYLYGCKLTNDGNAFILGEDYQGKVSENMQIRLEKIKRFALFVEKGNKDFLEYAINLREKAITDMQFEIDPENNLIAVGFYKTPRKTKLEGMFTYKVSYETKKPKLDAYPINKEQYQASYAYGEKEGGFSSNKKGFQSYFVRKIIHHESGGVTVISEQQVESDQVQFTPSGPMYGVDYNDILITRLENSRAQWVLRLPKRQYEVWAGKTAAFSFGIVENKEEILLFFNDNANNHLKEQVKTIATFSSSANEINLMVIVKPDGTFEKVNISSLIKTDARKSYLTPQICWKVTDEVVILYAEQKLGNKSTGRFVAVNLNEL